MFEISDRIQTIPVSFIRENKDRPKLHANFDPHGRDAGLVASVKRFGLLLPLLVDERKTLMKGYRRLDVVRFLGIKDVRVITLTAGESVDVFESLMQSRHQGPYAKIMLNRPALQILVDRGVALRSRSATEEDRAQHDEDWQVMCDTLQMSKHYIQDSLTVLNTIDEWKSSGDKDKFDKACRAETMFRERGRQPAAAILGERDDVKDDEEIDCRMRPVPRKKKKKPAAAFADAFNVREPVQDDIEQPVLKVHEPADDEQPTDEVFKRFNAFFSVYVSCVGTLTPEDHAAVAHFRKRIGGQLRKAAAA